MKLEKNILYVLIINIVLTVIFSIYYVISKNYEFLIYIGVIYALMVLIYYTRDKINFPLPVLWGLTIWSFMHMAGGSLIVKGKVLYALMIVQLVGEPYHILKFDQVVHTFGFAVATLVAYYLIKPNLKKDFGWISTSIVVVMAGTGLGALNEVIEFLAVVVLPETGVGGYYNTAIDMVSNLIGAICAMVFIVFKEKKD